MADDSVALTSATVRVLEAQLNTLLGILEALQRRLDQQDTTIQVERSAELAEQLATVTQQLQ